MASGKSDAFGFDESFGKNPKRIKLKQFIAILDDTLWRARLEANSPFPEKGQVSKAIDVCGGLAKELLYIRYAFLHPENLFDNTKEPQIRMGIRVAVNESTMWMRQAIARIIGDEDNWAEQSLDYATESLKFGHQWLSRLEEMRFWGRYKRVLRRLLMRRPGPGLGDLAAGINQAERILTQVRLLCKSEQSDQSHQAADTVIGESDRVSRKTIELIREAALAIALSGTSAVNWDEPYERLIVRIIALRLTLANFGTSEVIRRWEAELLVLEAAMNYAAAVMYLERDHNLHQAKLLLSYSAQACDQSAQIELDATRLGRYDWLRSWVSKEGREEILNWGLLPSRDDRSQLVLKIQDHIRRLLKRINRE